MKPSIITISRQFGSGGQQIGAELVQVQTIWKLAEQGPCVIVGRGANHILNDRNDLLNVYIYAERSFRLERAIEVYGVPKEQTEKNQDTADKKRTANLRHYTDQVFVKSENYHLCIDSGKLGIENSVKIIEASYHGLK